MAAGDGVAATADHTEAETDEVVVVVVVDGITAAVGVVAAVSVEAADSVAPEPAAAMAPVSNRAVAALAAPVI